MRSKSNLRLTFLQIQNEESWRTKLRGRGEVNPTKVLADQVLEERQTLLDRWLPLAAAGLI
jgi:hypothetical protein